MQGGELIERPKEYTIEAEVGQLEIDTFEIKKDRRKYLVQKGMCFQKRVRENITKRCVFGNSPSFIPVMSHTGKVPENSIALYGGKKGRR